MKVFTDNHIKNFILVIIAILAAFSLLSQISIWLFFHTFSSELFLLCAAEIICVTAACFRYFSGQNKIMETAASQINAYLAGDKDARIDCDDEGEMNKLFHDVNTMAAILNAHAERELQSKEFLKDTISDISHQLKTPLAALNIYNGLLYEETDKLPAVREFVALSEKELDRMETLVQNLLKMTKLDAHSIIFEKNKENVADMMKDIALHFSHRAKQEQKELELFGEEDITLFCDRDWLMEAVDNMIKNAFDHTEKGGVISVTWKGFAAAVQIVIKDNGSGIHPEDLHHIFKRFYRSRFSKDVQGIGLGLSLSKAIIEAHGGTIEVDSQLGIGTTFVIYFQTSIPTKL
ncbi:MAG: HAMP domain-containing histidine kinase [Lachnoclostridium sp.]|nr:HAMP domain-containing histidine kinase [Lachnospira sp.]MCM1247233.1 HAMP domain-containing histidine kinase [Lachnoclostridium sp.]